MGRKSVGRVGHISLAKWVKWKLALTPRGYALSALGLLACLLRQSLIQGVHALDEDLKLLWTEKRVGNT